MTMMMEREQTVYEAGEICLFCGQSVAFGSGHFVNRVPATRAADDGTEVEGWMCAVCDYCPHGEDVFRCNSCGEGTTNNDGTCHECGELLGDSEPVDPKTIELCGECRGNFDFDEFVQQLVATQN